jgi:hypothetical protein
MVWQELQIAGNLLIGIAGSIDGADQIASLYKNLKPLSLKPFDGLDLA